MIDPERDVDVCVGADERHNILLQLVEGDTVLQQITFDPDEADDVAGELTKWAAITRAKRTGAKGAA